MSTEIRELPGGIICIRRASYLTCSYMVKRPDGVVLIDAGMKSNGADVFAGLDHLGAAPADISAILLTHWHNDHSAGAYAAHEASGAPVYYHAAEAPYLTGEAGATGLRGWLSELVPEVGALVFMKGLLGEAAPRPVVASRTIEDGEILLGAFRTVATPGHTAGHVSYYYAEARTLFAGDALAVIDGELRFMARPVTLNRSAAMRSIKEILSLDLAAVCPGHREPLLTDVAKEARRMLRHIEEGRPWPLFG